MEDETSPETRAFVIKSQEQFDEAFIAFPEINLEKEMILVYLYTSDYVRQCKIRRIKPENGTLKISIKIKKAKFGHHKPAFPHQTFFVVKMNKFEIENVEFVRL